MTTELAKCQGRITELTTRMENLEKDNEELQRALDETREQVQALLDYCFTDRSKWKEGASTSSQAGSGGTLDDRKEGASTGGTLDDRKEGASTGGTLDDRKEGQYNSCSPDTNVVSDGRVDRCNFCSSEMNIVPELRTTRNDYPKDVPVS